MYASLDHGSSFILVTALTFIDRRAPCQIVARLCQLFMAFIEFLTVVIFAGLCVVFSSTSELPSRMPMRGQEWLQ